MAAQREASRERSLANYTGTDDNTYSSPPYESSRKRAALRYLAGALSGLGGAALRPGANFGQSLGLGFVASRNQFDRAQQAAMDYAQQQTQLEIQQQNARTQQLLAEAKGVEKDATPPEYRPEYYDTDWAKARRAADAAKAAGGLTTIVGPDGKPTLVRESDAIGKAPYIKPEKVTPTDNKPKLGDYDKMSDNFRNEPTVKDYNTVRDSYRRIESTSKLGTGFGDLAMIFSFMKVLDPGSTVREGEFANAQEAMGLLQKYRNVPRQWWTGTRLTAEGRAGILAAARELRDAQKSTYEDTVRRYKATAKKYGVDPNDFINQYNDTSGSTGVPALNDPLGIR